MKRLFYALVCVMFGGHFIGLAYAQDIAGAWSFQTDIKRKGCTISGNMTISQADESGIRTCSFVSSESCEIAPDASWEIDQTCRIVPQGPKYIIRSKVEGSLTDGYAITNYLPDHFVVEPESPIRMTGLWQDRNFAAPVVFWRDEALPVS